MQYLVLVPDNLARADRAREATQRGSEQPTHRQETRAAARSAGVVRFSQCHTDMAHTQRPLFCSQR